MFFRGLLGTLRWIIGLAPVILLGYWGAVYIGTCVQTLLDPQVPVVLTYTSPSGTMTARAESYTISLKQLGLSAQTLTLRGPKGELVAGASRVNVVPGQKGVNSILSLTAETSPLDVRLEKPYAKLFRDASGKIALEEFLPKSEGEPSKRHYGITVVSGVADIVDRFGGQEWRTRVHVPRASIGGVGKIWTASGAADIDGIGHGTVRAQGSEGLAKIFVEGQNLHLTDLYHQLARTDLREDVRGIDLASANGRAVSLAVLVRPKKPLAFFGTAAVEARGLKLTDVVSNADTTAAVTFYGQSAIGTALVKEDGTSAQWNGGFQWSPRVAARGLLEASVSNPGNLPAAARKALAGRATFRDARFKGEAAYEKSSGPVLFGGVSAQEVAAEKERLVQVQGSLGYYKSETVVALNQGSWSTGKLEAWARIDSANNLMGAVTLRDANLATVGQRYGIKDLSGNGSVYAALGGTTANPLIDLTSQGVGEFVNSKERFRGVFGLAANVNGDRIHLKRATWNGATGKALASGDLLASTGALNMHFDAFGVDLGAAQPDLNGVAAARGQIRGTLRDPRYSGRAEAYDIAYQTYRSPLAVADFSGDLRHLGLSEIRVASGQGLIEGNAGLRFKDLALDGELNAESLQPSDFGAESVAGVFDVDRLLLGGVLSKPVLRGTLKSDNLVASGINAKGISADLEYRDKVLNLTNAVAKVGTGQITGQANFAPIAKDGSATFKADALPLSAVPESLTKQVLLDGTVSAEGRVDLHAGKATLTALKGTTDGLAFNRVLLGSGDFDIHQEGDEVSGSAEIGSLQRYLRAQDISYDMATRAWSLDLITADLDLQNLYQLGQPYLTSFSEDMTRKLNQVNASVSADAHVEGVGTKEPTIDVKTLDIGEITYAGSPLGKINAKGSKKGALVSLTDFTWIQGDSTMTLKGSADMHGDIDLNGEVSKFNFANIGLFEPRFAGLAGEATISFLASGKTEAPEVMASLDSNRVRVLTGQETSVDFGLEISSLHLIPGIKDAEGRQTGKIEASGSFNYRGIGGTLDAHAPFAYPFEFPENQSMEATVALKEQQISAFKDLLPSLDLRQSQGSVSGSMRIFGPLKDVRAEGGLTANAPNLVFAGSRTALKDATASLTFADDTLLLSAMATSSKGGTAKGLVQSKLADFSDVIEAIGTGQTGDFLKSPLQGSLDFLNFRFDEGNKDSGTASGAVAAHFDFGGTMQRPKIGGSARLLDGMISLGNTSTQASELPRFAINPAFDVDLGLDAAKVRSGTTQIGVIGGGKLAGSLQRPDLTADMTVLNGSLRLPGAKVNLEPGGTMRLAYQADQEGIPQARLDVALQGRTAITAARPGGNAQRYDITLDVRGNLLQDGGLTQTATADPPDLSQDRILALLGQTQIFEAFTGQGGSGEAQKNLRDALTGYALPIALDPITSRIAEQVGLDYLTVEYNAFDLTTITFARALSRSFIVQGRRQIGEPLPGRKAIADLQLIYRLPVRRGLLNRVSFSIGIDQDRPWKLSAQYSSRF